MLEQLKALLGPIVAALVPTKRDGVVAALVSVALWYFGLLKA